MTLHQNSTSDVDLDFSISQSGRRVLASARVTPAALATDSINAKGKQIAR
jgi:hypothetical protein